jgi:hypothetical protein
VLFVGTIRYNLDPFGEHADAAIWGALGRPTRLIALSVVSLRHGTGLLTDAEQAYLKDAIAELPLGLNSTVIENGENFSVRTLSLCRVSSPAPSGSLLNASSRRPGRREAAAVPCARAAARQPHPDS